LRTYPLESEEDQANETDESEADCNNAADASLVETKQQTTKPDSTETGFTKRVKQNHEALHKCVREVQDLHERFNKERECRKAVVRTTQNPVGTEVKSTNAPREQQERYDRRGHTRSVLYQQDHVINNLEAREYHMIKSRDQFMLKDLHHQEGDDKKTACTNQRVKNADIHNCECNADAVLIDSPVNQESQMDKLRLYVKELARRNAILETTVCPAHEVKNQKREAPKHFTKKKLWKTAQGGKVP